MRKGLVSLAAATLLQQAAVGSCLALASIDLVRWLLGGSQPQVIGLDEVIVVGVLLGLGVALRLAGPGARWRLASTPAPQRGWLRRETVAAGVFGASSVAQAVVFGSGSSQGAPAFLVPVLIATAVAGALGLAVALARARVTPTVTERRAPVVGQVFAAATLVPGALLAAILVMATDYAAGADPAHDPVRITVVVAFLAIGVWLDVGARRLLTAGAVTDKSETPTHRRSDRDLLIGAALVAVLLAVEPRISATMMFAGLMLALALVVVHQARVMIAHYSVELGATR